MTGAASAQDLGALMGSSGQPRAVTQMGAGPGHLGVQVQTGSGGKGAVVVAVEPGSPAEASGIRIGDVIYSYSGTSPGFHRPHAINDQASLDAWLAANPPGGVFDLNVKPAGAMFMGEPVRVTLGSANGSTPYISKGAMASQAAGSSEKARSAYLQMCGRGAEKLGPATCESMRRDMEAAAAAESAAAHQAEVMALHRQLCGPGARSVSEETCASILAEAKTPPSVAPAKSAKTQAAPAGSPRPAAPTQKSAYGELCGGSVRLVSAETCAALRADEWATGAKK